MGACIFAALIHQINVNKMKKGTCVFLLSCFSFSLLAQLDSDYRVMAADYESVVIAQSGLKLRANAHFSAKMLAVIPFGEIVQHGRDETESPAKYIYDADSIMGTWKKVSWKEKHGYVFSAYLGRGILKMDKPFYLLAEQSAWCWEDSYISPDYAYYGVFPNVDTTVLTIKKCKPFFASANQGDGSDMGGTTFFLKQKQLSLFAFASKEPFSEYQFNVSTSNASIRYDWNQNAENNGKKISIPKTNWEIRYKLEELAGPEQRPYKRHCLIIKDKKTGAWHYLFEDSVSLEYVQLVWSGDMDGDGIQDFMLKGYNSHSGFMALFLSKNPGKWKFVKLMGIYHWGDCC
jgi:hypothetical protein